MITITREKKFKRKGWDWIYSLVGPDNYHSTDKNLPALRQMAGRRYPGVEIVEEWNQEDESPTLTPTTEKLLDVYRAALAVAPQLCRNNIAYPEDQALLDALDALEGETT